MGTKSSNPFPNPNPDSWSKDFPDSNPIPFSKFRDQILPIPNPIKFLIHRTRSHSVPESLIPISLNPIPNPGTRYRKHHIFNFSVMFVRFVLSVKNEMGTGQKPVPKPDPDPKPRDQMGSLLSGPKS